MLRILFLLLICAPVAAQTVWQPSSGHTQIPIWPANRTPDPRPAKGPEVARTAETKDYVASQPLDVHRERRCPHHHRLPT